MKLPALLLRRLHWINLPGALLIALLQRTPVLRMMSTVGEIIQAAPMGHVLRSTVAATATLGAMHSLAGATQFVQNPSGTIRGTVGQTVSVGFTIVGSPLPPNEYFVDELPPGLRTVPASQGGRVPSGSPVISGIPTQAGTFTVSVTGSDGTFSQTDTITFVIAAGTLAPAITAQPGNQSVSVGGTATFSVTATGSPAPTYQWRKDTNPIAGATSATLTLTNVALSAAGSYSVVVSNSAGNVTSDAATLTVAASTSAPSITTQPVNQTASVGGSASFTVVATGTPAPAYQWLKNTAPIDGATSATLVLSNVQSSDAANYAVRVSNSAGSVTSATVTLTLNATSTPPVIVSQPPVNIALSAGQSLVLNVGATGAGLTYQWRRIVTGGSNPAPIAGETNSTLNLKTLTVADAGLYTCVVSNTSGSATTVGTALFVAASAPGNPGHLVNLSVLTAVNPAGDSFKLGYVVNGASAGNSKSLVIRAAGPALATFGVPDTLADPKIELFASSTKTGENDDWGGVQATANAMASVGAFPYTIPTSRDAAMVTNITGRDNSVQVSAGASVPNGTGTVIAEVYEIPDAGGVPAAPRPRLINVSVLKNVGDGLTMGFVVGGDTGKTLLIRAVGPSLTPLGVSGAMADPKLELLDSTGKSLATNDNWGGTASLSAAFTDTGAFGLTGTSKDAAILATLPPGNFTAQVKVATGSTGVALVEVYDVP